MTKPADDDKVLFMQIEQKAFCDKHSLSTIKYCLKCVTECFVEQIEQAKKEVAEEILDKVDKIFSKLWIKLEEETPATDEMTNKLNAVSMPFDFFLTELRKKYLTEGTGKEGE